ncbi:MAG: delta-aminolevulinic acid dehydratase [Ignavibacteriae bacterium]|nr:delta-aminolevulinic acid dehydratase [Ignavibacteriota bacterium]
MQRAADRLLAYIQDEHYRGYDPYDVLTSPLFRLPVLRSSRIIRFVAQQVFRRIPINARPFFAIKKGYNPVTLGLCVQAYAYLSAIRSEMREVAAREIEFLLDELERLSSKGFHGACWGYDFDWQGRYANIPAYTPTVVATGIISNGLVEAYRLTHNQRALELGQSAVEFVLNDLKRTYDGDSFCFSYSPNDTQRVFNASMKGVRLLAQVFSFTHDTRLLDAAQQAARYVIKHQRANGSWAYSEGDARTWSDNYHTAYVLDCLLEYARLTNDQTAHESIDKGFKYYRENFFQGGVLPKYYDNKLYPIDATSIAQSIITLARFKQSEDAIRVAEWAIDNFIDEKAFVYYQRMRYFTHRTSYMRWSNAWMLCALTYLQYKLQNELS